MKFTRSLSLCVLALSLLTSTAFASNGKTSKDEEKNWLKHQKQIEKDIAEIGGQGPGAVNEYLMNHDFKKADIKVKLTPMSSAGNISIYGLDAYYDTTYNRYLVKGFWEWNDYEYVDSNAGAADGIALALTSTSFSQASGMTFPSSPAGISVYDQNGKYYSSVGAASKISGSGVAYTYQDQWLSNGLYVGYKGQVWFWMKTKPTNSECYLTMDYEHTWSNANLNSTSIKYNGGIPEITMTFSTTPSNWHQQDLLDITDWPVY